MKDAKEFAKALIDKNENNRYSNTVDGNMIINKMLYFAQIISLAKYGKVLFENDLFAFENGSVVEDVRLEYKYNYDNMIKEANEYDFSKFSTEELDVLKETNRLFSDFSARELSQITHSNKTWIDYFEGSKVDEGYLMSKQKMPIESLETNEVPWINEFLAKNNSNEDSYIVNNNITFYYSPNSYDENEVIELTNNFKGSDKFYTIVKEGDGKAVIY